MQDPLLRVRPFTTVVVCDFIPTSSSGIIINIVYNPKTHKVIQTPNPTASSWPFCLSPPERSPLLVETGCRSIANRPFLFDNTSKLCYNGLFVSKLNISVTADPQLSNHYYPITLNLELEGEKSMRKALFSGEN
jgi:hypothetical protein